MHLIHLNALREKKRERVVGVATVLMMDGGFVKDSVLQVYKYDNNNSNWIKRTTTIQKKVMIPQETERSKITKKCKSTKTIPNILVLEDQCVELVNILYSVIKYQ